MRMRLVVSESSRVCCGFAIDSHGENACCTRTESGSTRRRSTVTATVAVSVSPNPGMRGESVRSTFTGGESSAAAIAPRPLAQNEDEDSRGGRHNEQRSREDATQRHATFRRGCACRPSRGTPRGSRRDRSRRRAPGRGRAPRTRRRATPAAPRSPPFVSPTSRFVIGRPPCDRTSGRASGRPSVHVGKLCSHVGSG